MLLRIRLLGDISINPQAVVFDKSIARMLKKELAGGAYDNILDLS